jgi:signal peptidase I
MTFIFQFYRTTSRSNEPTLKYGQVFFSSKWKKPGLMRFLIYRATTPETGLTTFIHRICGLPGDTVEIRNGVLFVNGADIDKKLNLKHVYKLTTKQAANIEYDPADAYTIPQYPDILYVPLTDSAVRENQWSFPKYVLPPGLRDSAIFSTFKRNWNQDNFGPLRVPSGKYFVLGDNREQSMDSRYQGFIDSTKFLGCVLWK